MDKPLIAVDLDGTLLDTKGRYSERTRDFFRALSAQGYPVVLASGRPYRAMRHIYEDLHCFAPVIAYNGQLIFNPSDPAFPRYEKRFPKGCVRALYRTLESHVDAFMAETEGTVFVNVRDERLDRYFPYAGMNLCEGPLDRTVGEDVFTCLFKSTALDENEFRRIVRRHDDIDWRSWSDGVYSELFFPTCDKGIALGRLLEEMNLSPRDAFAFGDAENDISMLRLVGHPYAMRGCKSALANAGFPLTENPVDEDGVMETLSKALSL